MKFLGSGLDHDHWFGGLGNGLVFWNHCEVGHAVACEALTYQELRQPKLSMQMASGNSYACPLLEKVTRI